MFPRNLNVFRFGAMPSSDVAGDLANHAIREPGPLEMSTRGFASPYPFGDSRMTVEAGAYIAFVYAASDRLLPASVVHDQVQKDVDKIVVEEARKVGNRERRRIKDDVLHRMVPHAPVRSRRIFGWFDTLNGWLIVDTSSRKVAEQVLSGLREAFGSFPAVPVAPENSPREVMTDWLASDALPDVLALGDECELRDPATATGSVVRCRRQDLDGEEIKEHLRNGKQVFQLGLIYDNRLSLVLTDTLAIARLRPLDVLTEHHGDAEGFDAQLQSDLTLASLEVCALMAFLEDTFKLPRPAGA